MSLDKPVDHEKRVVDALGPLCEPLHDVFSLALARGRERLPEFVGDRSLQAPFTHAVRGLALHGLRTRDLGAWKLLPQNNAGISITHGTYSMRVLHRLPDKSAPPPGTNRVRQRYYANDTLDESLFPVGDRLLALWGDDARGALSIRVVRPVGQWSFGSRQKVDLDFMLPATAEDLSALVFDTSDTDIVISIPQEEDAGDDRPRISG